MIDQLFIYLFCYLLGWCPLYYLYRRLEQSFPFQLQTGGAKFSFFFFFKSLYVLLEFLRAFFLMEVVHQWLIFDWDLFVGVGLFLAGVYWPVAIPKQFQTVLWLPMIGIYAFLLPWASVLMPVLIFLLVLVGVDRYYRYLFFGGTYLLLAVILTDMNSLYLWFYLFMVVMMMVKCYSLKSDRISLDKFSVFIRS